MSRTIKEHIADESVGDKQAFSWITEWIGKHAMNTEEDRAVKSLLERVSKDFSRFKKESIRWNLIKGDLTKKQTEKLIDEL